MRFVVCDETRSTGPEQSWGAEPAWHGREQIERNNADQVRAGSEQGARAPSVCVSAAGVRLPALKAGESKRGDNLCKNGSRASGLARNPWQMAGGVPQQSGH